MSMSTPRLVADILARMAADGMDEAASAQVFRGGTASAPRVLAEALAGGVVSEVQNHYDGATTGSDNILNNLVGGGVLYRVDDASDWELATDFLRQETADARYATPTQVETAIATAITGLQPYSVELASAASVTGFGYIKRVAYAAWSAVSSIPWADLVGIPTVTAGNGLTGGGSLVTALTLAVAFAGSGIANTVARSDHRHDLQYVALDGTNSPMTGALTSPNFIGSSPQGGNGSGLITNGAVAWYQQSRSVDSRWWDAIMDVTSGELRIRALTDSGSTLATPIKFSRSGSVTIGGATTASSYSVVGGTASGFLKANGTVDTTAYIAGNQTITLSGDVSGSGATSISTTLASIVAAGSAGSASVVPVISWDTKGRISGVSTATITPSAIGAATAASVALPANQIAFGSGSGITSTSEIARYASGGWLGVRITTPSSTNAAFLEFISPTRSGASWGLQKRDDQLYSTTLGCFAIEDSSVPVSPEHFPFIIDAGATGSVRINRNLSGAGTATFAGSITAGVAAAATSALGTAGWFGYTGLNGAGAYIGLYANSDGSIRIASQTAKNVSIGTGANYGALVVSDSAVTAAVSLVANAGITCNGWLVLPGGTFRDLVQGSSYGAYYVSGVTPAGGSTYNYSMAFAKDGTTSFLSGTTASYLAVNGAGVVRATSTGAEVTGDASITGRLSYGGGLFRDDPYSTLNTGFYPSGITPSISNAALLFSKSGSLVQIGASSSVALRVAGVDRVYANSSAVYLDGAVNLNSLVGGGIAKALGGTGTMALATSGDILAGISSILWIGQATGRSGSSLGIGHSTVAPGALGWGWALAQDSTGDVILNAPAGRSVNFTVGGPSWGSLDAAGWHMNTMEILQATVTGTATISNLVVTTSNKVALTPLTATAVVAPGYAGDILNITGPAHSLAPAPNGSTYRQYRMPTAAGKTGIVIVLIMGISGSVNAPYLYAYSGQVIRDKANGAQVATDSAALVSSGTISLISDGASWWIL